MQQLRPVTMQDIAKLAHVSQSTVSRVLSPSTSPIPISEETKARILDAVKQLGYQPNLYAGSLRGKKTYMIAMLVADISNPFYHPMVRAVQDIAHRHRYDVMIANSDHLRDNEMLFCESLIRRPVDGVIVVPYYLTSDDLERLMQRTGACITVLGGHIEHPQIDTVLSDDGGTTYDATRWLIEAKGHRRIGFIGVTRAFAAGARRQDGFLRAMQEAGLPVPAEYLQEGDWSVESGERAIRILLQLPTAPTAVFACNDHMAIGALITAQKMNLRVPEDLAIVGFDDIPQASWIRPQLTTVAQCPAEIGRCLAEAVFQRIEGSETGPARRFELPLRFIERESA